MSAGAHSVRIALLGAAGRMGRAIIESAHEFPGVSIGAALVQPDSALLNQLADRDLNYSADLEGALTHCDVLIDFATPEATAAALERCVAAGKPVVIGVTGLDAALQRRIEAASRKIAVLTAANMSPGVNLLLQLVRTASAALGDAFDVEIIETHHRHKKDAPSGTALALGEAVAAGRGVTLADHAVYDRAGKPAVRETGSIGFTSIRAGEIVGEHTVLLAGAGERLELTHRANSRATFANGALAAARWLAGKPAGRYTMADVLGLPSV
ncbi:MAG TPA: 4-hydroxy-tetrahydrodipicolinate reductase [Gammaproteobacteria bacterium]|nr:4-hydroxy-tetrahydrodipicolinate reductase [Gammaproteobacteria bacterium]